MTCIDNIQALGPDAVPCANLSCEGLFDSALFHRLCLCLDWQGNPIPDCVPELTSPIASVQCTNSATGETDPAASPEDCQSRGAPWGLSLCYCCCEGSGGGEATIAVPEGERPTAYVEPGDEISAATRGPDGSLAWAPATAGFAGSRAAGPAAAVLVGFGDSAATVAASDQLFLQPTGRLKRADELEPGADSLVAPDGRALPVRSVGRGGVRGAIHHVAAGAPSYEEFDGPDGHLVAIDGVVAGDYATQLYQGTEKMAAHVEPRRRTRI
jgi:hypothetical protein